MHPHELSSRDTLFYLISEYEQIALQQHMACGSFLNNQPFNYVLFGEFVYMYLMYLPVSTDFTSN